MRRIVLAVFVVMVGCSKSDDSTSQAVHIPTPPPSHAPAKPKPSSEIPTWATLDISGGSPAVPTAWVADTRPTLAVFSASWCPGCTASAIADRELVRVHGTSYQIGVALQEESEDTFAKSKYARALSGVPVWSEASVAKLTDACHPRVIPSSCLFHKGKVLWTGSPGEAGVVLAAHQAGKLDTWLANAETAELEAKRLAQEALEDPSKIPAVVAASHGRVGWQNSIAWRLVDRDDPSPNGVALAVALARDAVASDGGIDFAHLDTYALALAKAGRVEDAAYVGARVIAVCDAVEGNCREERRRAEEFIAANQR